MKTNRRIVKTLVLEESVPYGGAEDGQLKELVFFKPRGKTMRRMQSAKDPGDQSMLCVYDLTEVPIAVLDLLDLSDSLLASAIGGELVEAKYQRALERGKELGIKIPELPTDEPGNISDSTTPASELEAMTKTPEEITPDDADD